MVGGHPWERNKGCHFSSPRDVVNSFGDSPTISQRSRSEGPTGPAGPAAYPTLCSVFDEKERVQCTGRRVTCKDGLKTMVHLEGHGFPGPSYVPS